MYKSLKIYVAGTLTLVFTILMFSDAVQAQQKGQDESRSNNDAQTVVEVVKSIDNVSQFAVLLDEADLEQQFNQPDDEYTVLAPTNEAMDEVDPMLKQKPDALVDNQIFNTEMSEDDVSEQTGLTVKDTYDSAINGTVYVVDGLVQSQNMSDRVPNPDF